MTVQTPDVVRPRGTLRRRIVVGSGAAASLIVLAGVFFFWQLTTLRSMLQDLGEQNERLALALETAQQATSLVVAVQDNIGERIPAVFVDEVGAVVQALGARQELLSDQLRHFPEGDPMRLRIEGAMESLQNLINVAEGTIRHVEDENWPAAEMRANLLLARHDDVEQRLHQLVAMARDYRLGAETRANETMARMVLVTSVLVIVAFGVAVVVISLTTRSIAVGVEQLSRSAKRLAEGHFDERIPTVGQDELGQLAQAFNTMARELRNLYAGLERQVAERTADLARRGTQLEAAAQVARNAAAIRDVDQLMEQTVRLISDRFGFYHAGIFLLDDTEEYAVLQAASSEGGQRMLARRHKLKVGEEGIVGYASGTGEPRIALDVGADAVFFNNPDLPNTRSEMGLPLKVRGRVIGVLDVQSKHEAAFSDDGGSSSHSYRERPPIGGESTDTAGTGGPLWAAGARDVARAYSPPIGHLPLHQYKGGRACSLLPRFRDEGPIARSSSSHSRRERWSSIDCSHPSARATPRLYHLSAGV